VLLRLDNFRKLKKFIGLRLERLQRCNKCANPLWWKTLLPEFFVARNLKAVQKVYIVRGHANAGIGDQILTSWSETYVLAKRHRLIFVHTPFIRSPHCPNIDLEIFFGFGQGELDTTTLGTNTKRLIMPYMRLNKPRNMKIFEKIVRICSSSVPILIDMGEGYYWCSPINQGSIMPAVYRQKYWATRSHSPWPTRWRDKMLRIALHVRRGDVVQMANSKTDAWQKRWIDLSYYINILELIKKNFNYGVNYEIRLFSDGNYDQLRPLIHHCNAVFVENSDIRSDFHDMVCSDILICSSSSYSILAGKIGTGIKILPLGYDDETFPLHIPETRDWFFSSADGLEIINFNSFKKLLDGC
jgi:hypothetical protein